MVRSATKIKTMKPSALLFIVGIAAPVVYLIAVVVGGLLWPTYSHIAQPVSDLIAAGAPTRQLLEPVFAAYGVLTVAFGSGLLHLIGKTAPHAHRRLGQWGAALLILEGVAGLLTLLFPEGAGGLGSRIELAGWLHIAFAASSSLTSIASILLIGVWLVRCKSLTAYGRYSLLTAAFVVCTGLVAAVAVANGLSWAGLAERLTIGGFLQWLAVVAVATHRHSTLRPESAASR